MTNLPSLQTTNRPAIDPTNDLNVLFASGSAIYRSVDGGATFKQVYSGGFNWRADTVVFAPGASSAIAVGGSNSALRSDDGGATWTDIGAGLGGPSSSGYTSRSVAFDPSSPSRVLLATDTGVYLSTTGGK